MRNHIARTSKILVSMLIVTIVMGIIVPTKVHAIIPSPGQSSILSPITNSKQLYGCNDLNTGSLNDVLELTQHLVTADPKGFSQAENTCSVDLSKSEGITLEDAYKRLGYNPDTSGPGLSGMMFNATAGLLTGRTTSGIIFALDQADKLITPGTVYAADTTTTSTTSGSTTIQPYFPGTGYSLLSPIYSFWGWAAGMSFSFMTLIIIFVAFAMIFRARLGGKQAVQIQSAIPGIILAMILIPLSYPISGLFIDAITASTNVFHDFMLGPAGPGATVYGSTTNKGSDGKAFNDPSTRGLYADDWRISSLRVREQFGALPITTAVGKSLCTAANAGTNASNCDNINLNQFNLIDSVVSAFQNNSFLATFLGGILNLVFNIIAFIVTIRITWRLLKKYVMMIFLPITSPFIFATIAIPGQGTKMLFDYFKQLGNASLHFIVTYCLFLTVVVFANPSYHATVTDAAGAAGYKPPILAGWLTTAVSTSTDGGINSGLIFTVLSLGLFLTIPSILDSIDKKLKVADNPFFSTALKELRSSGDVAFRQLPAAVGTLTRGGINGVVGARNRINSARDSFRAPGELTIAEKAQTIGADRVGRAELALADALAMKNGPGRVVAIARARAGISAARLESNVKGQGIPESETKQEIKVTFEGLGKGVMSQYAVTSKMFSDENGLKGVTGFQTNFNIVIESTVRPFAGGPIYYGPFDNDRFTTKDGKPIALAVGTTLYTYKAGPALINIKVAAGSKVAVDNGSKKATITCDVFFLDNKTFRSLPAGTKLETTKLAFQIGGARSKGVALEIQRNS